MATDFRQQMGLNTPPPNVQRQDPMTLQTILSAQLMQDEATLEMQQIYKQLGRYYDNPKSFNNEQLQLLQQKGARLGIEVPLAAKDKATALEQVGTAIVGVLDSMVIDFIPDDWYSSRRTETARAIGNWAGILIPAAVVAIGSGGMAAPGILAALGATAMRGGKKAAFKLGGRGGLKALRSAEETGAKIVNSANNWMKYTPGGWVGKFVPQGVKGVGTALGKFGPTAKWGDKILETGLGQKGFQDSAKGIIKKAQRFAKKGDTEGVLGVLDDVSPEMSPYLKGAVEGLAKEGKLKGITKDILEEATSKFGKTTFDAGDLDDIAKNFMGYKKGGAGAQKTAQKVMDGLRDGLKNNKSIDDIIGDLGIPKARGKRLKELWNDPASRSDLLKKLAENTPEAEASLMGAIGDIATPLGIAGFEGAFLGSSEGMDELGGF